MDKQDYEKYYQQGGSYIIPTEIFNELFEEMVNWREESKQLKEQLEYLRSGEYLNQLKWERNMLEDLIEDKKLSNKEYSMKSMMKANTSLCERIEKAIEMANIFSFKIELDNKTIYIRLKDLEQGKDLLNILKGDSNE